MSDITYEDLIVAAAHAMPSPDDGASMATGNAALEALVRMICNLTGVTEYGPEAVIVIGGDIITHALTDAGLADATILVVDLTDAMISDLRARPGDQSG